LAIKSYNTIRTFTGNGVQTVFNFALPFLRKTFIKASVNGVDNVYGTDYTVDATEELTFTVAPPLGQLVIIKRTTSTDPLVTWNDGSVLLAKDLSLQETQLLHIQEEMNDAVQTDAAENAELCRQYADNALVSENNAKTSETNSKTSENNAKTSETNSKVSETNAKASELIAAGYAGSLAVSNVYLTNTAVVVGQIAYSGSLPSWGRLECAVAGTTASTEPTWGTTIGALIADGTAKWYVDDVRNSRPVGNIEYLQFVRAGQVKANGAVLNRADYPRLWTMVSNSNLAVSEASWPTYLGTYSSGDGSTTFRVPDLRGTVIRGLDEQKGLDVDGTNRIAGSYQGDSTASHTHTGTATSAGSHNHTFQYATGTSGGQPGPANNSKGDRYLTGTVSTSGAHVHTVSINAVGGMETRMKNVGLIPQIKY